ncbi:MAG: hypothetical protein J6P58_05550 [Oscillospiraceae bacterium]|nr:hypothetical protein [Oscillospiraceae bacterium]
MLIVLIKVPIIAWVRASIGTFSFWVNLGFIRCRRSSDETVFVSPQPAAISKKKGISGGGKGRHRAEKTPMAAAGPAVAITVPLLPPQG